MYTQRGGFCTQKASPRPPGGDLVWAGEGRQRHFSKRHRFVQYILCKDHKGDIWPAHIQALAGISQVS